MLFGGSSAAEKKKRSRTEKNTFEKLITFKTSYEISTVPQLTSTSIYRMRWTTPTKNCLAAHWAPSATDRYIYTNVHTNAINIYVACVQKCAEINLFAELCAMRSRACPWVGALVCAFVVDIVASTVAPFHTKLNYIRNYVWNLAIACWSQFSVNRIDAKP